MENFNFGEAIGFMKMGYKVARKGWNGKGIYIALHKPENEMMTQPFIYINTTGLVTDNEDAPKNIVPWLASQTDMLAEDWVTVDDKRKEPMWAIVGKTVDKDGDWPFLTKKLMGGVTSWPGKYCSTKGGALEYATRITDPKLKDALLYANKDFEAIEVEE